MRPRSLAAVLLVIYGLKKLAENGLGWLPAVSVGAGVAIGILFVRRQRTLATPLIDLNLFRVPAFNASLATYTIGTLVAFGIYIFIAQYLQLVLGLSPLQAGLATLPSMLGFILGSMVVPGISRRVPPAHLMGGGFVIAAIGFAVLTGVTTDSGLTVLIIGSIIYSVGISPVVILATDLIVGSAPVERAGAASAISETSSELGGRWVSRSSGASALPSIAWLCGMRCREGSHPRHWRRRGARWVAPCPWPASAVVSLVTAVGVMVLLRRVGAGSMSPPFPLRRDRLQPLPPEALLFQVRRR